ncbi:MAG: bifunctional 4-hydroxy-2-oxoglutarate aldolase/2-dehydro-3-deoxy-phosphogluconate aldolase [Chloroflexota bacterium]
MARHSRLDTLNAIRASGMTPIFYTPDADAAREIVRACHAGGARVLEFTNRGDFALEVFQELERFCARELPDVALGAGSVMDAPTASAYIGSGASFIVSPATHQDVARVCNRRKVAYIPGCGTPSEISAAEELGSEFVKVFPGDSVGGPGFVRAVLGPMPWTSIIPTGGVDITRESLAAWFNAGVVGVGIGSRLVSSDVVKARDWGTITERTRQALSIISEVRGDDS